MVKPNKNAIVRVPGTTANLGPGFDCLGVALRIYNTVTITPGTPDEPHPDIVTAAAETFFRTAKRKPFPFSWDIHGDVPRSRGLGSSVTVRLGILHGLNALCGLPLSREKIFSLCAKLEGHPDNAAPATFGGFSVARPDGSFLRFPVSSELSFVLLIPEQELPTAKARRVLPARVTLRDAVENLSHTAFIAAAFASRNYQALRGCFSDRLHEPYRAKLLPPLPRVIEAGVRAGALGGWLSGAGSTIACITMQNPEKIARAMHNALGFSDAHVRVLAPDNKGATVRLKET